jgi:RNA polymerase sigma-70 factor (ECF subfamily)
MTVKEYNISVEKFSDDLFRFILKSIKDKDVASDIVQDTFVKVWKNAENVSFSKSKSYLFSTAYHTMIDWTRREKKKERFDSVDEMDYSHTTQYFDTKEILDKALNTLPEQQKNLVLLRDYEGYSYQEIGEICSLSEAQVKVYIYRARKALKKYLVSVETII